MKVTDSETDFFTELLREIDESIARFEKYFTDTEDEAEALLASLTVEPIPIPIPEPDLELLDDITLGLVW
ncbi:TPA: hypothetical protein OUJ16_002373 [Raoultella ornithinolytica]|nr:hypothetical protein [Raoultella ornithinolytica]